MPLRRIGNGLDVGGEVSPPLGRLAGRRVANRMAFLLKARLRLDAATTVIARVATPWALRSPWQGEGDGIAGWLG